MRRANVYLREAHAGKLIELDRGYRFTYRVEYLSSTAPEAIALTLPLTETPFETEQSLHPFFDGLIPEGWLLQLALGVHDVQLRDRFGLLLATGRDTIGAVRVIPVS